MIVWIGQHQLAIAVLIALPFWILMGWLGNKARRWYLRADAPYEERVRDLKEGRYR